MSALAALLLAGAATEGTPLLDAFKAACGRIDDYDAARADAAKAGWTEAAEDADPRIARLVKFGRDAVGDDMAMSGAYFRQTLSGRTAWLIVSRAVDKASGVWGNGCRVYDLDATAAIAPAALEAWMGKPPTHQEEAMGVTKRLWEPGWRDGVTLEINFVPPGHAVTGLTGLQGNVLVAQAIGGF
jgi:hypothetical protein